MRRFNRSLIAVSILLMALILGACQDAASPIVFPDPPSEERQSFLHPAEDLIQLDKNSRGVTEAEIHAFDVNFSNIHEKRVAGLIFGINCWQHSPPLPENCDPDDTTKTRHWALFSWTRALASMHQVSQDFGDDDTYLDKLWEICAIIAEDWEAGGTITLRLPELDNLAIFSGILASCARMGLEKPSVDMIHISQAVRYANIAASALLADIPTLELLPGANGTEVTYAGPEPLKLPDGTFVNVVEPWVFNIQHLVILSLIDLTWALDSEAYRLAPTAVLCGESQCPNGHERIKKLLELLERTAQLYNYWNKHASFREIRGYIVWNRYSNENRDAWQGMIDNPSHASITINMIGELHRNRFRLNQALEKYGSTLRINLSASRREEFVAHMLNLTKPDFYFKSLDGSTDQYYPDEAGQQTSCEGFIWLTMTDPKVFDSCVQTTLWIENAQDGGLNQPYVTAMNYANLLLMKPYARYDSWMASAGTSFWKPRVSTVGASHLIVGDFDGDDEDDILGGDGSDRIWVAWSGKEPWIQQANAPVLPSEFLPGDFDGDGTTDLLIHQDGQWRVSFGEQGRRSISTVYDTIGSSGVGVPSLRVGDFDGDGTDDLFHSKGGVWSVSYGTTGSIGHSGWEYIGGTNIPFVFESLRFGDFDGDGVTDIFRADGPTWWIAYGQQGQNQHLEWKGVGSGFTENFLQFGDFDGDERTDIFALGSLGWYVSHGRPDRVMGSWDVVNDLETSLSALMMGDFDGDSRTDVLAQHPE